MKTLLRILAAAALVASGLVVAAPAAVAAKAPSPRFKHVVVVVMENHSRGQVLRSNDAPYLRRLAHRGIDYTNFHAETHPSEPNYLAMFSGSTHGVSDDSCPLSYKSNNLGHQLRVHGYSFAGYSESLPRTGWTGCSQGSYARKHVPWADFTDLPRSVNRPFSRFPKHFAKLPTVSFVVPNLDHDMHDGTVAAGDSWVRRHLGRYATWARTHHSLLIVTFDEDDDTARNLITTIAVGQGVPSRASHRHLTHYGMLAAIEHIYHLPRIGHARHARLMPLR